jgi:hypothetical protein
VLLIVAHCAPTSALSGSYQINQLLSSNLSSITNTACYVIGHSSELWRALMLARLGGSITTVSKEGFWFNRSWRDTLVAALLADDQHGVGGAGGGGSSSSEGGGGGTIRSKAVPTAFVPHTPIKVHGFYSDTLFAPWFHAAMWVNPAWCEKDNIDRVANLTPLQFRQRYEEGAGKPVILTDVVTQWPAYKTRLWSLQYLKQQSGEDRVFAAGPASFTMGQYWEYARQTTEENPLYLFDKHFGTSVPNLLADYSVPVRVSFAVSTLSASPPG